MVRKLVPIYLLFCVLLSINSASAANRSFLVADHSHVTIEWWYVNAHITTNKDRHYALVGAFFRFGAMSPRAHYLIYGVTDLDKKTHRSYSLADSQMVALLHAYAPLLALTEPGSKQAQTLLASLAKGHLPPGNQEIAGKCVIRNYPFRLAYGASDGIQSENAQNTAFMVKLGGAGADTIDLHLTAAKPPMAVGGNGETGLKTPSDMHYYSLTQCRVSGDITVDGLRQRITGGEGWFDHQWGNSWVADNDGWDWFGAQLSNGTDILFFRQRDLATGKIFYPLATFMDKDGNETVTKDIVFTPEAASLWKSPITGAVYPLAWTVTFPTKGLVLHIKAVVKDQEMPILGPGGGIWEGACTVDGDRSDLPPADGIGNHLQEKISGVAYMELVGYDSLAVKQKMQALRHR